MNGKYVDNQTEYLFSDEHFKRMFVFFIDYIRME